MIDQTAPAAGPGVADQDRIHDEVRARYAEAAVAASVSRSDSAAQASCCGPDGTAVFGEILYDETDRAQLPEAAVLASLGCGNPTAVAELRPGERVLDLGSGGGIDVLLSARRVGPTGRAIGLDMTDEMLALAQRNAAEAGVDNVEFIRGTIESIPLPAASVDVVISNCVINLAADKAAVFSEIARVLRPGGRVGVSDVVADDSLSPADRAERGSFSGCIAGALSFAEYRAGLAAVGLVDVSIESTHAVGDGLHGAIIKATRPLEALAELPAMPALPRAIAMLDAGADGCGCGSDGCC
ncbi:MAG TPA: arsenite methyltransferase [Candidatus Deferrimicrobium sp.]|nr:arsenite methyltransferase [Candidatus Deferrimicrobium sp.]